MRLVSIALCFALGVGLGACGSPSNTMSQGKADLTPDNNTVPLLVDSGPLMQGYNVPYVTITLCAPGTHNCATIDHITVDTGSTGLRIISSVMPAGVLSALPSQTDTFNDTLAECYTYADGYTWGSIKLADFTMGGKSVDSMALMIIGDPAFPNVPTGCASGGPSENTLDTFGSNGIIGVGIEPVDCDTDCQNPDYLSSPGYLYYACSPTKCVTTLLDDDKQVPNPVAKFASDNNGVVVELPTIDDGGATTAMGTLVFGIGTQDNNALGDAHVVTLNAAGRFVTDYKGKQLASSFIDSGSTDQLFDDTSIAQCAGVLQGSGRYCPPSTLTLSASMEDGQSGVAKVSFKVGNSLTLFDITDAGSTNDTAFDDLGDYAGDDTLFDWGIPFFYGRHVFTSISGAITPAGSRRPFYAF